MMAENFQIIRRKKLIEVAIPLEAINNAASREKSIRHGHPSTLHLWWARRPLAASRGIIFCQLVDDPSSCIEEFQTEEEQNIERKRLFLLIEELVQWKNVNNLSLLNNAKKEISKSWKRCCLDNKNHPNAKSLFDPNKPPALHDPFAGGGSIPAEAKRLGLESYATDLNPIAVLINKSMIDIPSRFVNKNSINPDSLNKSTLLNKNPNGLKGLADDIRYFGKWMEIEAEKKIGNLYPKILITKNLISNYPDFSPFEGKELKVSTWLWVRTIKSPNPSFAHIDVPLASTFLVSNKKNKEVYIEPIILKNEYKFKVRHGKPQDSELVNNGTKISRGTNFKCIMSGTLINGKYIKEQSMEGKIGRKLMAIIVESPNGKVVIDPQVDHEEIANKIEPDWEPTLLMNRDCPDLVSGRGYGFFQWSDLFSSRQLQALSTFTGLIENLIEEIKNQNLDGENNDEINLFAEGIATYLAFAIDKCADYWSCFATWMPRGTVGHVFSKHLIPMTWDYPEANPFANFHCSWSEAYEWVAKAVELLPLEKVKGSSQQIDASTQNISENKIISTDPPYYDNIAYADLSDFFYVWLRRSLKKIYPSILGTISVPKNDELVASAHRHGNKKNAEKFFLEGMKKAMGQLSKYSNEAFPITIYYAFKQSESKESIGTIRTGWATFIEAIIDSGLSLSGTWPVRTERTSRSIALGTNALASSIVLVCTKRDENAKVISRAEFRRLLRRKIPKAIKELELSNIAPVDLAQASIGPGISIFSQAKAVLNPDDSNMDVREALIEVNSALDEFLSKGEVDLDNDSIFALRLFESFGYEERNFGEIEVLARAINTSIDGVVQSGILYAVGGKVRLLKRDELDNDWDPNKDNRLSVWEATQYLIRTLETEGELGASKLLYKLKNIFGKGDLTSNCRSLAYRLFNHCEKNKQAEEARSYNTLIISWPELEKLSYEKSKSYISQKEIF